MLDAARPNESATETKTTPSLLEGKVQREGAEQSATSTQSPW